MQDRPVNPDSPRNPEWTPRGGSTNEPRPVPTGPFRDPRIGFAENGPEQSPTQASDSFMAHKLGFFQRHQNAIQNSLSGVVIAEGAFYAGSGFAEGDLGKTIIAGIVSGLGLALNVATGKNADLEIDDLNSLADETFK